MGNGDLHTILGHCHQPDDCVLVSSICLIVTIREKAGVQQELQHWEKTNNKEKTLL